MGHRWDFPTSLWDKAGQSYERKSNGKKVLLSFLLKDGTELLWAKSALNSHQLIEYNISHCSSQQYIYKYIYIIIKENEEYQCHETLEGMLL